MEVTISRMVGESLIADKRSYTWKDIQRSLGEDEAAVEILQFNYQPANASDTLHVGYWYAAFVITRETSDHPQCILVPLREQEGSDYMDYKTFMETEHAGKLSDELWIELNQAIAGKKTIYFSPDGGYHKFNLESFTDQEGQYAISKYKFKYMNSLLELMQAPTDYSNNQLALLVGDPSFRMSLASVPEPAPEESTRSVSEFQTRMFPGTILTDLPGTRTEVDSIGSMFTSSGWNCSTLTGNSATEEAVSGTRSPRVLHLATHGFFEGDTQEEYAALLAGRAGRSFEFNLDAGARSCLFFSGAQSTLYYAYDYQKGSGDGILTAGEIMEMDLDSTELVVLSACDTGLGDVLETGGIYGLRRSFHLAGARRVMISLWKVDDQATQLLMREFYSRWLSGLDMDDSLQEAKKYLIDHTEFSHPKYWAAFILSGI
jgi:CHAT domain-containing protein